ncbi:MAG TPA: polyprenyl diphosphate synthase [Thermoleophilaceae bacterium]|nr:polyprenyl diphosphate synthase [Thermoleophilaceae bacterium]
MDGNARWARGHGLPVLAGHREGAKALKRTVRHAVKHGVAELTVYAFSTENWTRPEDEVDGLMAMFAELIESETPELDEEGVRMMFIGRREEVSDELREKMAWAEEATRANDRMKLFVAFNYGGRAEIVDAAARYEGGGEEEFAKLLYAPDMDDPDVLIRTSGELRVSNFLLWQTAYSELHFADVLWPDFDEEHLVAAIEDVAARERRYGAR